MYQALIIGCGFGDDAEWFAAQGFTVTAFDISPSAIDECRRRFAASKVVYDAVDLFKAPAAKAADYPHLPPSHLAEKYFPAE